MNTKTILITGGTGGIGKAAALELAKQSHHIIITGRDKSTAEKAVAEIQEASQNKKVDYYLADMSSLADINNLAEAFKSKYDQLDVLINNVGIVAHERQLSEDKIELNFAVHTLAPFVLYKELLPLLSKAKGARVVNVLTQNHAMVNRNSLSDFQSEQKYIGMNEYGKTKLYNLWWLYDLASSTAPNQISFFGADPGPNNTQLMTNAMKTGKSWPLGLRILRPVVMPIMKSFLKNKPVSIGARSIVFAATARELEGKTGLYINDKGRIGKSSKLSYDTTKQREMGKLVEEMYHLTIKKQA